MIIRYFYQVILAYACSNHASQVRWLNLTGKRSKTSNTVLNPLYSGNPETSTFANSEDSDEMQHNAAFHQGLLCLSQ